MSTAAHDGRWVDVRALRAELAELKSWMDDNDDSFIAELHEARAETSRLRIDHATAYANTVALAKACARLRAELADLNYHYECAVTDRDVANSELAEWRESALELDRKLVKREAAIAKLDTTCRSQQRFNVELVAQQQALKATIARVRELCDRYDNDDWSWSVPCDTIRAAIEGNQL